MSKRRDPKPQSASGWMTDAELTREFTRPVTVSDAVISAVMDAIEKWPELSETPPLYAFVDVENLDGLFKEKATTDHGWLPSAMFRFQGCRITILYGETIRVIIERDP